MKMRYIRKCSSKFLLVYVITIGTIILAIHFFLEHYVCVTQKQSVITKQHEVRHLAYLKVHKTGSSTIQNIFFRFGIERNLTFVLPSEGAVYPNVISNHETIREDNIKPPPSSKTFDILCLHVLYNRESFKKILPTDAVYIASLRDPFEQFMSTMLYFPNLFQMLKLNGSDAITDFLEDPEKHDRSIAESEYILYSFTKNRMAIDLGFPAKIIIHQRKEDVQKYIEKLDKELSLVLITEYLDESVVLLKRILHWSMKEIIYLNKNINTEKDKSILLNKYDRRRHRALSQVDYALYDYFYRKLWRQIEEEERFHEEVLYFKNKRREVENYCTNPNLKHDPILKVPKSEWNEGFTISKEYCEMLLMSEAQFTFVIRNAQYTQYSNLSVS